MTGRQHLIIFIVLALGLYTLYDASLLRRLSEKWDRYSSEVGKQKTDSIDSSVQTYEGSKGVIGTLVVPSPQTNIAPPGASILPSPSASLPIKKGRKANRGAFRRIKFIPGKYTRDEIHPVDGRNDSRCWRLPNSQKFACIADVYIIGARKAGSSSMFEYLKLHPQLRAGTAKEPRFFSRNDDCWATGKFSRSRLFRQYVNSFPSFQSLEEWRGISTFEASVHYMSSCVAPQRIKALVPNAKIILLIREPIARFYSCYQMRESRSYSFGGAFTKVLGIQTRKFNNCSGEIWHIPTTADLIAYVSLRPVFFFPP